MYKVGYILLNEATSCEVIAHCVVQGIAIYPASRELCGSELGRDYLFEHPEAAGATPSATHLSVFSTFR
jgi:hypothetical protein